MAIIGVGGIGQGTEAQPKYFGYNRIICPLPPHGWGFEDRVNNVVESLQQQREKSLLVGTGAGAKACIVAASRLPKKVKGIIAVAPAPFSVFPQALTCSAVMMKYLWSIYIGELFDVSELDYFRVALRELEVQERSRQVNARLPISGKECRDLLFNAGPQVRFKALGRVPILVVVGEKDRWVRTSTQQRMAEQLLRQGVNCELISVKGSGHMPCHIENDILQREILDWVENNT